MNKSKSLLTPGPGANRVRPSTHQEIAALAFSLHLKRGGGHGHDREDWLKAEQMLILLAARPAADLPGRNGDVQAPPPSHLIEHPHARDQHHSPDRGEIRQMNTSHRPAARESNRSSK